MTVGAVNNTQRHFMYEKGKVKAFLFLLQIPYFSYVLKNWFYAN